MKKYYLYCLLFIRISIDSIKSEAQATKQSDTTVYAVADHDAEFNGGMPAFFEYLKNTIIYPQKAVEIHKEGKVFLSFTVEKDGTLSNIKVMKHVSDDIDAEGVRVIKSSPKWNPAILNGKIVRESYTLPINFVLPPVVQTDSKDTSNIQHTTDTISDDTNKIFSKVDVLPTFKGGINGFLKYLEKAVHYPAEAKDNNIQGKVLLTFVVEKDGTLSKVTVLRSVSKELDAEAVRVFEASPKWNPGLQKGKPVRVQYTMPMSFSL